jgi:hypothetical protein
MEIGSKFRQPTSEPDILTQCIIIPDKAGPDRKVVASKVRMIELSLDP